MCNVDTWLRGFPNAASAVSDRLILHNIETPTAPWNMLHSAYSGLDSGYSLWRQVRARAWWWFGWWWWRWWYTFFEWPDTPRFTHASGAFGFAFLLGCLLGNTPWLRLDKPVVGAAPFVWFFAHTTWPRVPLFGACAGGVVLLRTPLSNGSNLPCVPAIVIPQAIRGTSLPSRPPRHFCTYGVTKK